MSEWVQPARDEDELMAFREGNPHRRASI